MATAAMVGQGEREHWRFSLDDYHRLIEIGVLNEDTPVELIDGELLTMSPINPRHNAVVSRLTHLLVSVLGDRAIVRPQCSLTLPPASEPEPDLTVLHWRDDFYVHANPEPADVHLVIEVADSSARFDRLYKLPLYARSGISEAWLVDLAHDVVLVATEPSTTGYATVVEHRAGVTITPAAFPDVAVDVAPLLRR
jgi:Uma2 family endonuclease